MYLQVQSFEAGISHCLPFSISCFRYEKLLDELTKENEKLNKTVPESKGKSQQVKKRREDVAKSIIDVNEKIKQMKDEAAQRTKLCYRDSDHKNVNRSMSTWLSRYNLNDINNLDVIK